MLSVTTLDQGSFRMSCLWWWEVSKQHNTEGWRCYTNSVLHGHSGVLTGEQLSGTLWPNLCWWFQIWCHSSSWICTTGPHLWKHTDPQLSWVAHFSPTKAEDIRSACLWVHYNEHSKTLFFFSPQGLALINGTQMITSLGCEAVERASAIARQADIVAALTLEVLKGTTKAFDTGQQVLFGYSFNQGDLVEVFRHRGGGGGWQGRVRRPGCSQYTQDCHSFTWVLSYSVP